MMLAACGEDTTNHAASSSDTKESVTRPENNPSPIPDVLVIQDIPVHDPLSDIPQEYQDECLKSVYLRCPPYTEYWIAEAIIDACDSYSIVTISNCRMQHECDPLHPLIVDNQPCQTEDGGSGIQDVFCDKGKVQLDECDPCTDEICDGVDNDCDGEVDEGSYECETDCGAQLTAWTAS